MMKLTKWRSIKMQRIFVSFEDQSVVFKGNNCKNINGGWIIEFLRLGNSLFKLMVQSGYNEVCGLTRNEEELIQ